MLKSIKVTYHGHVFQELGGLLGLSIAERKTFSASLGQNSHSATHVWPCSSDVNKLATILAIAGISTPLNQTIKTLQLLTPNINIFLAREPLIRVPR